MEIDQRPEAERDQLEAEVVTNHAGKGHDRSSQKPDEFWVAEPEARESAIGI
jgi:hypothetical protein